MIEAAMIWNEPNNKSHWDFENDPGWAVFSEMTKLAGQAIAAEAPGLPRVLGGISPIDPDFIRVLQGHGALDHLDAVAVHGFPLDWNHWMLEEWPDKLDSIHAVTHLPVWVSEVGISTFGAEEVQEWGLRRTAELLRGRAPRIHWYSLYDLPAAWPATTRHREAEGSSYYRHFHMGLLDENGRPKRAAKIFHEFTPEIGLCQWFHFEDHRLDDAVRHMKDMGVTYLRTGLSWADWYRPDAERWFDRQMRALDGFDVTVTYCFTPEDKGQWPHYTAVPKQPEEFADFCAAMTRRYAPGARFGRCRVTLLEALASRLPFGAPVALVVAHPDDETLAAGGSMHLLQDLTIIHVTDGAPLGLDDARRAGFATPDAYADARRRELLTALRLLPSMPALVELRIPDQDASLRMQHIADLVSTIIGDRGIRCVLTHAYEGGHPDHDAVARAIQTVAPAERLEFPGYHAASDGTLVTGRFLPGPKAATIALTPAEQDRKRAMLACFVTQSAILSQFGTAAEQFRPAPTYDFSQPPHPGRLNYEHWGWAMTGERWRALACAG